MMRSLSSTRRVSSLITCARRRGSVSLFTSPSTHFIFSDSWFSPSSTSLSRIIDLPPNSQMIPSCLRRFSTESEIPNLSDVLDQEIAEEEESGNNGLPNDLAELKKDVEQLWTVIDAPPGQDSSGTVKLIRKAPTSNGSKVAVSFHCQDTVVEDDPSVIDNAIDMLPSDEEEEEEESVSVRFTVLVTRMGKRMEFSCLSSGGEPQIESIAIKKGEDGDADDDNLYGGPEFGELAQELQDSLAAYMEDECGVNNDVASFVAMYADYKEQLEYLHWMKSVRSMI